MGLLGQLRGNDGKESGVVGKASLRRDREEHGGCCVKPLYGSLFSGVGGIDSGLDRAGWRCAFQVEKDEQCRAVLRRHWPDVPRFNDVREFNAASIAIRPRLLCGGFPCTDLSVAGRRSGIRGEASGLFFEFMRIAAEFSPDWLLIENVPGLLSSWTPTTDPPSGVPTAADAQRRVVLDETSDFDTVTRWLEKLGYGWAMRTLDARYFDVPQRRERVFFVCHIGDCAGPAQVLFDAGCLQRHPAPREQARPRVAASLTRGSASGRGVNAPGRRREDDVNLVPELAHTLRAEGHDGSEDGTGRGTPIVPVHSIQERASAKSDTAGPQGLGIQTGIGYTLESRHHVQAIAFDPRQVTNKENRSNPQPGDPCPTMHEQPAAIAYRTSGNCGVTEQGDKTAALTTATDPNANIVAYQCQGTNVGPMGTLRQGNGNETGGVPFVFQTRCSRNGRGMPDEVAPALTSAECGSHADTRPHVAGGGMAVRRLLPVETERLQGFPDGWSEWGIDENGERVNQSDSARYRQMGNAVCCNVAFWIGRRLMEYMI